MNSRKYIALIPAYNPNNKLIALVKELEKLFEYIVVVNDGSTHGQDIFDEIRHECILLNHSVNLGKGRALKTGFNEAMLLKKCHNEISGLVTIDADGQHSIADIATVRNELERNNNALILGSREFTCKDIPLRSRFGNQFTRIIFKWLCGINISDTQTGLRGIPISLLEVCCHIDGEKYDYETNMLLTAKQRGWLMKEVKIAAIYEKKNESSHFNPLFDSLKIYKIIFKYSVASMLSVLIDFSIFQLCFLNGANLFASTYAGRAGSAVINFTLNRLAVFKSNKKTLPQMAQYFFLVIISGTLSAVLIRWLHNYLSMKEIYAKIPVEIVLYFFNYYIQSSFIFVKLQIGIEDKTDWTNYYQKKRSVFSTITQRYTLNKIQTYIQKFHKQGDLLILECGGGNSCFAKQLCDALNIAAYHIIDNNELGISLFEKMDLNTKSIIGYKEYLSEKLLGKYDFVYSIGVIEHFRGKDIEKVIQNHFKCCKKGGFVLISFPTPTLKYRIIRKIMEILHIWQFKDEKPLLFEDVKDHFEIYGNIISVELNKKLPLSQLLVLAKK